MGQGLQADGFNNNIIMNLFEFIRLTFRSTCVIQSIASRNTEKIVE